MFPISILSVLAPLLVLCQGTSTLYNATEANIDTESHTGSTTAFGDDAYTQYLGSGAPSDCWPLKDQWVSFENMFSCNEQVISSSCPDPGADGSEDEVEDSYDGIQQVSLETSIDQRFILAVIMEESLGCIRVHPT